MYIGVSVICAAIVPHRKSPLDRGTVTDSKGGVVPNAKVTITNTDSWSWYARSQLTTARVRGTASARRRYSVTAEIAGFKKVTQSGVVLNVNDSWPSISVSKSAQ